LRYPSLRRLLQPRRLRPLRLPSRRKTHPALILSRIGSLNRSGYGFFVYRRVLPFNFQFPPFQLQIKVSLEWL
jgi:hypothetical protein